jgi:predicted phage gp36 major capsid-like protein
MDIEVSSHAPETKAGIADGRAHLAAVSHDDVMRLFEEFKAANDERLDQIERRSADVVTEDKVERINAALTRRLDELTLKSARPALGAAREGKALGHDTTEHKAAFESYMRSGESAGLRALETKALSAGSNPDGGYTVPVEIEQSIGERLNAISPIRSIAGQRTIHLRQRVQEAVHDRGSCGRLGRRNRRAHADHVADARRAELPGDGALRHAGGDRDLAGGLSRQHRPMARRRS